MNTTTGAPVTRDKALLKRDFPDWNFVHSDADRWWAFLDPKRRGKDMATARTTALDADTAEELYKLLAEATS
ncbi:hypothetical protein [Actinomadura monticuli]|uniref:Uncharacterized protein n=1 Tax=Actinomadura monticuli TaxID=3097367 RepID=A0ABV4Q4H1_9ACTN